MLYLIDTHAWIEYFLGSENGDKVRDLLIDGDNEFVTAECSLAEIKSWCINNNQDFERFFRAVRANSTIVLVNTNNWIDSGEERSKQRKVQKNFGLIDAILLVKQKELGSKIITGDNHFKNLKNVLFLE